MHTDSPPDPVESTASRSPLDELVLSIVTVILLFVVLASVLAVAAVVDGPPLIVYSAALTTGFVVLVGLPIAGRLLTRAVAGTLTSRLGDRQPNRQENRHAESENRSTNRHHETESEADPVSARTRPSDR